MTDHLADARACATSASRSPSVATAVFWLNATCEQIIAHLEAQNAPREAPQPERIDLMTDPKLHELLDQTKFGDQLILAHRIGKHATHISGPVLTDQTHDPSVGIDLLDGDPHIVRTPTGVVWAPVVQATLYRGGELIAKWDADIHSARKEQAPPQLIIDPSGKPVVIPRPDDEGPWTPDTEDVEFCFDYLEAQNTTGATMTYTPTIEEVREAYDRWLAAHDAEVRAQALREAVASLRAKFGPTNRAADYLARAEQIKEDR